MGAGVNCSRVTVFIFLCRAVCIEHFAGRIGMAPSSRHSPVSKPGCKDGHQSTEFLENESRRADREKR